jgi:hypothetical protein
MGYRLRPEGTDDGNPLDWCQKPSLFFFFFFNVRPARATIITSRYPLGCSFVTSKSEICQRGFVFTTKTSTVLQAHAHAHAPHVRIFLFVRAFVGFSFYFSVL